VFDEILFGLTSAISLAVSIIVGVRFAHSGGPHRAMWAASFAILFVVAAGVALNGLAFLSQTLVAPVSSLIPGFMAAGLLWTWKRPAGSYYARYVIAAFVVLLAATLAASASTVYFVAFVHAPSGLIVFLLPFYLVLTKKNTWSALFVGIGGLLIGVGGMALATLSAGVPLLPSDLVTALLAPIFFAMTVFFGLGLLATPGWVKS
jgi:hypothetical protein